MSMISCRVCAASRGGLSRRPSNVFSAVERRRRGVCRCRHYLRGDLPLPVRIAPFAASAALSIISPTLSVAWVSRRSASPDRRSALPSRSSFLLPVTVPAACLMRPFHCWSSRSPCAFFLGPRGGCDPGGTVPPSHHGRPTDRLPGTRAARSGHGHCRREVLSVPDLYPTDAPADGPTCHGGHAAGCGCRAKGPIYGLGRGDPHRSMATDEVAP